MVIRPVTVLLLLAACRGPVPETFSAQHQAAQADSVTQVMQAISRDVDAQGLTAWIPYLDTSSRFVWTSDGSIEFPDADSLARFIRSFAATLRHSELAWEDLRVAALAPGAALATTRYREMWVDQRGDTTRVQGVFVGALANGPSGWRIVSGNTSHAPSH